MVRDNGLLSTAVNILVRILKLALCQMYPIS
jgi:hypothetical protein